MSWLWNVVGLCLLLNKTLFSSLMMLMAGPPFHTHVLKAGFPPQH